MNKLLLIASIIAFAIVAIVQPVKVRADGAGSPAACETPFDDSTAPFTWTAPPEYTITGVCIKSGQLHTGVLGSGLHLNCYTVVITAGGGNTATVTRTGTPSPTCQEISHVDFIKVFDQKTPTPTATLTRTPTQTATVTSTATVTRTVTPTQTKEPTWTPTLTATATSSSTPTITSTSTPVSTATVSPTSGPSHTPTTTVQPTSTTLPSVTPTQTPQPTSTALPPLVIIQKVPVVIERHTASVQTVVQPVYVIVPPRTGSGGLR